MIVYQWIDNNYGPMGTFSAQQRRQYRNHPEFTAGYWKKLSPDEIAGFHRWLCEMHRLQN